jgi:hypothetical protein
MHRANYERRMAELPSREEQLEELRRTEPGCLVCKRHLVPRGRGWPLCPACESRNTVGLRNLIFQRPKHTGTWSTGGLHSNCGCTECSRKPPVDLEELGEPRYRRALLDACLAELQKRNDR